ncbi:alanine racemase [Treponema sp.]|uniref:alanine racemase n=1 Tax=Treponema sp. TaxID=166 RepID=UPI00298DBA75|nr:alanine racemase [Treponema sp.]MCR5612307.1 alanine racemase [Treponema sp.]
MRLTHAEINLSYLKNNIKNIKSLLKPETKICCAVKAGAYGNGAVECAKAAVKAGADFLAIANVEEGRELREAGIKAPLLMLSLCCPDEIDDVIKYSITPLVFDKEYISLLDSRLSKFNVKKGSARSKAGHEASKSERSKAKFPVHLAIDSGMGRIGCYAEEAADMAKAIVNSKNLKLGGMCTHFAVSDSNKKYDVKYTKQQFENFMTAVKNVEAAGINPGIRHSANSAAAIFNPDMQLDMVRPGIIIYGYYPDLLTKDYLLKNGVDLELKPVMSLVSGVCAIRHFKKGNSISYGRTWIAKKDTDIAVIPAGYGDGFLRRFNKIVKPVINGKAYSICGRICMDQFMIDLGKDNKDVKRWDKVILFGAKEDGAFVDAQDIADATGTIPYEIMTGITKRVERVFVK